MANQNIIYAQRHYESALESFEKGLYSKAIQEIDKAIQNTPNNPDMQAMKGVFFHRMNELEEAEKSYNNALKLYPEHSFSHFNLGIIKMKQDLPTEAILEWQAVLKHSPEDIEALFNIGVALIHVNKWREAIHFFEKVIEIQPDHAFSVLNLAVIYKEQSEYDQARFYFNRLKMIDNTYLEAADIEIEKCNQLEKKEREQITIDAPNEELSSLIEDDMPYMKALFALAEEKYEEALNIALGMLSENKDDESALMIKGQAMHGLKKTNLAIAAYTTVLKINPRSTEAMFNLGEIFREMNQPEKALEYYQRVVDCDPGHSIALNSIEELKAILPHRR